MSTVEKVLTALVGVAMVTTLILPKRQTPQVISAFGNAFSNVAGTVMGTKTKF
jgi:hypothetical protein